MLDESVACCRISLWFAWSCISYLFLHCNTCTPLIVKQTSGKEAERVLRCECLLPVFIAARLLHPRAFSATRAGCPLAERR